MITLTKENEVIVVLDGEARSFRLNEGENAEETAKIIAAETCLGCNYRYRLTSIKRNALFVNTWTAVFTSEKK